MIQLRTDQTSVYKNLLTSYERFIVTPELEASQKAFFSSLSELLPTIGLQSVIALERGVHYREALLIQQGKSFNRFPDSLKKLRPLAEDYCLTVGEILIVLKNPPKRPESLKEKLEQLGLDHLRFREAFNAECLSACAETYAVEKPKGT